MAGNNQVIGRATISLGALGQIATEHGATLDFGGVKRTPKPADDGNVYFTAETGIPELNCKALATVDVNPLLLNFDSATVIFEADTGQQYMLINAFSTDPARLDAGNGTYESENFGSTSEGCVMAIVEFSLIDGLQIGEGDQAVLHKHVKLRTLTAGDLEDAALAAEKCCRLGGSQ